MKKQWFNKFLYLIISTTILSAAIFIWADNELNAVMGKSTKVIEIVSTLRPTKTIQIKNTSVLSEDCNYFVKNQDVILKDGVIMQIGTNLPIENNVVVINGTSKFLIPGLIDSHVHLKESRNDLFLYLVNGVTSVREMAGSPLLL